MAAITKLEQLQQLTRACLDVLQCLAEGDVDRLLENLAIALPLADTLSDDLNNLTTDVFPIDEWAICEPNGHLLALKLAMLFIHLGDDRKLFVDDISLVRTHVNALLRKEYSRLAAVFVSEKAKREQMLLVKTPAGDAAPVRQIDDPWSAIPAEYRTRPISFQDAAKHLGKGSTRVAANWVRACVDDGTLRCIHMSRITHIFDIRQFPDSARRSLQPQ